MRRGWIMGAIPIKGDTDVMESAPMEPQAEPPEPQVEPPGPLPWHSRSPEETVSALGAGPERGLSAAEAPFRLKSHGPNSLAKPHQEPWWEEVVESLTEPLILLLLGVALLYGLLGEIRDALTILFVILAVSSVEVVNEGRAKRAIAALRELSSPTASVLRDGLAAEIPSADLVPGDLLLLRAGDRVPADLRLLETVALRVDESSLTGEAVPVAKDAAVRLPAETELGDRRNMAYAGTLVAAGKGRGLVVATGRESVLGRIAGLAEGAREPRTPLQQQMRELSGWLLWLALGFSLLVPLLGVLVAGQPPQQMILTGLSLAFATIPEELPILITIVLGIGSYRLARERAIVKQLRAAETLGSVSAIGTDKTGTLTENRMRVARVFADGECRTPGEGEIGPTEGWLMQVAVLANDAQLVPSGVEGRFLGDPTETALLEAAEAVGVSVDGMRRKVEMLEEYPFDDVRKRMGAVYRLDGELMVAVKGAPESVLVVCSAAAECGRVRPMDRSLRDGLLAEADRMAAEGLRVIGFAGLRMDPGEPISIDGVESGLTFLGMAGLEDPPRPEAAAAVASLKSAGVRVLMLTGDHPATARAIALRVGIPAERVVVGRELELLSDEQLREVVGEASLFARIAPEHKLRVVRALAARGEVVAVTGDGVNDAPALREAAIGVAMGQSGTDVAREAADLVLLDDNLATVTSAVREGRKLYENLHKAIRFYLAAKVALIVSSLVSVLALLPVPFAPVQIIVMELFMDLGASTTFVAERPEGDVMARPPRDPRMPFMNGAMQFGIFAGGLSLAAAVVVAYWWSLGQGVPLAEAQTAAFVAWMVGHLVLAAHMRSERQPLLRLGALSNRAYLLWVAGVAALVALGVGVPFFQERLHMAPISPAAWAVSIGAGLVAPAWWEALKWARWIRRGANPARS